MPSTATDRIDGVTTSVAIKAPCRAATNAAITLSGEQTVNGVAVVTGDRVLVKDQASSVTNGIYVANTSSWSRAPDFDGNRDVVTGTLVPVRTSTNEEEIYRVTTANPIVIGSSAITFEESVFIGDDSSAVTFLQAGTGAVARTVREKLRDFISVKDFGAVCDDSTDDTAAIQAAIDVVGDTSVYTRAGVDIHIPGPCRITTTLTIRRKGVRLVGNGWGYRDDTGTRRSYLRWDGIAGIPMVKFSDCVSGAGIFRLNLKGKTTAKPSAAIELNETNDSVPNQQLIFEQVYIGPLSGETGAGDQFEDGFLWTGTNVNNAEQRINGCYIIGVSGKAIRQSGTQQQNCKIDHLTVVNAGTGIYVCGAVQGSNWNFAGCDIDIEHPFSDAGGQATNVLVNCHGYYSEGAGRMIHSAGVGRFLLHGGFFQITSSLNADGKVIVAEGNSAFMLDLKAIRFSQASSPPASPYLSLRAAAGGATQKNIRIEDVVGWSLLTGGTNGLDVATRGPTDRRYIYFCEDPQVAAGTPIKVAQNFLSGTDADWDISHFDVRGNTTLRWWDDFLGDSLDAKWRGSVGSDGACVAPTISSGLPAKGVGFMTTGADAGGTMALNGAQLDLGITNFPASAGGLVVEIRVSLSAITDIALFVGLTDQASALEMPFTLGAGDTLTSNATDAVGWLFDTGADTDNWWLVGVANNVDATKANSARVPTANVFEVLRIEIDSAGTANFYRNGAKIGSAMSAAVTTTVNLTPVIAAFSRAGASRNVFFDYVLVESSR